MTVLEKQRNLFVDCADKISTGANIYLNCILLTLLQKYLLLLQRQYIFIALLQQKSAHVYKSSSLIFK